jgi:glycosyltransferase involved in cell wall biosynthesis
MRIVYVLTSLGIGGAERQALELAERISRRGHAVSLLVLRPRLEQEWPTSLPVVHLEMRRNPGSFILAMARARRFLRDIQPDLVHSHGFHANIVARLLRLLVPAPAVVSTIHNIDEGGRHRMTAYRLTDALCRRTTTVSQAVADRFIRMRAVPAGKCTVILNGIDCNDFVPDSSRRAPMREEICADQQDAAGFLWLAAGRLAPAKDYPNLLRAFAQVRASRSRQARLLIAGEGSAAALSALSALAAELGLNDSVRWLGLRRDLPALLDAADGFVLSSAWEGMPLALAEAMCMEKPVVATDAGGVRELVADAGTIVPAHSSEALAQAMLALMHEPLEARQALGRAARQRIEKLFSIDARADDWEALYRGMVDKTGKRE